MDCTQVKTTFKPLLASAGWGLFLLEAPMSSRARRNQRRKALVRLSSGPTGEEEPDALPSYVNRVVTEIEVEEAKGRAHNEASVELAREQAQEALKAVRERQKERSR